jgi:hypothetical protein
MTFIEDSLTFNNLPDFFAHEESCFSVIGNGWAGFLGLYTPFHIAVKYDVFLQEDGTVNVYKVGTDELVTSYSTVDTFYHALQMFNVGTWGREPRLGTIEFNVIRISNVLEE